MPIPAHHRIILFFSCIHVFIFSLNAQPEQNQEPVAAKKELKLPPRVEKEIDSLKALLKTTPESVQKITLYREICWLYSRHPAVNLVQQYADSAQALAKKLMDEEGMMQARYCFSILARLNGAAEEALNYITLYIQYCEYRGDSAGVARGLYQLGNIHIRLGNFEKSLAASFRALTINERAADRYGIGLVLASIGTVHMETMKYHDAEKSYLKALQILDSLDEWSDQSRVLINLGNIYTETGNYEKAKQKYQDALRIDQWLVKERGVAFSLAHLGYLYDKTAQYDTALAYQLKALAIREQLSDKDDLAKSLNGAGLGYMRLRRYRLANSYLMKALSVSTEISSKPILLNVYENLAKAAEEQGRYGEAFRYQQSYIRLKDSIFNIKIGGQLAALQTKYATAEKDKQIILLAKEKQVQEKETQRQATLKKAFIAGLLLLSLLTILMIYIFRQRLKNQKLITFKNNEIKEIDFKRQMSELEMKALRAQINPHFLFNCMNSINRMILKGETENASSYLTKFSKLVRLILENAENARVSLENEMALLESYIQLEGLRFKGKINYSISIDESIEPESTYLPSMVLQPFVENAIWHGLMHKKETEKGNIFIGVKEENDRLLCTIEDNGVGRERAQQLSEKSVLKKRSMGMKITEDRLRLLNQGNPKQIIRITDMKDSYENATGTRIEINIPIS